jgi:PAS domain S-box-containing protein
MSAQSVNGVRSGAARERALQWLDFESDSLAVHVLTEDGMIAATNRAFAAMFGGDRAMYIGRHHAVLNNHSVAANLRLLRDIRCEVERHGSWRGILTNRSARGLEFSARAHIYPMRTNGVRQFVCFQQAEPTAPPLQSRRAVPAAAHAAQAG